MAEGKCLGCRQHRYTLDKNYCDWCRTAKVDQRHAAEARVKHLEELFSGLTPGGSEFANDLVACAEFLKERLSKTHSTLVEAKVNMKTLEARVRELELFIETEVMCSVEADYREPGACECKRCRALRGEGGK